MKNFEKIQALIADALYVDKEEVTREANLMKDLGAESIDFLDVVFRLEKEFGIKMPKGEVEKKARGTLTEEQYAVGGRLTDAALAQLRKVMPEVAEGQIKDGLMVRDIPTLFTVATFERMVEEQLFGTGTTPEHHTESPEASSVSESRV